MLSDYLNKNLYRNFKKENLFEFMKTADVLADTSSENPPQYRHYQ